MKGLSSEQAFQTLARDSQYISKARFQTELEKQKGVHFTAPEMELLFAHFDTNQDGRIHYDEWKARIYEDSTNPLALLREVIQSNHLSSEELLHKMKLRIWDEPLTLKQFKKAMHELDPTLTDGQLKALAASMKDGSDKVPVMMLVQNLVGNDYETVDFRNRIY